MTNYSFNTWVNEYADFGLDVTKRPKDPEMANQDYPLNPLNVEYVIKSLKGKSLGEKYSIPNDFFGELQWGDQDGAIRLGFSSGGGTVVMLKKLTHDLEGEPTWICKKVIEVKNLYDEHPDRLIFQIKESLTEIDQEGIDAPVPYYEKLERLVLRLASELRRNTTQKIFIYEGIRVVQENYKYIIHFGVTGMGVQRRGQKRLDQFAIHTEYSKKTGLIKITGTPLGDVLAQHRWIYDPSTFIEWFSPSQKEEEINKAILAHFNCY